MLCHRDRRMTKPVAAYPCALRITTAWGQLRRDVGWQASTSSWRLASSPMALVTRPYRLPPRAARLPLPLSITPRYVPVTPSFIDPNPFLPYYLRKFSQTMATERPRGNAQPMPLWLEPTRPHQTGAGTMIGPCQLRTKGEQEC